MGRSRYMYTYLGIFDKIAEWIFSGISKAISWLFEKIFGPIFRAVLEPVSSAIAEMLKMAFSSVLYAVYQALLRIVDVIQTSFMVFAGIRQVTYKGKAYSLVELLFTDAAVARAFWGVTIIAITFLFLFTIAAVVRKMADLEQEENRSLGRILTDFIKGLISFFAVPALCLSAVLLSTAVMTATNLVTDPSGGSKTMAATLFDVSVSSAVAKERKDSTDKNKWTVEYDGVFKSLPDPWKYVTSDKEAKEIQNNCIDYYIKLWNIDYVVGYFSAIFLIWNLIAVSFQFVQRIFEITLLYIVSPFFAATLPLDGGEKLKKWQGMFAAKLAGGLGMIVMVNLYLMLVPIVMNDEINLAGGEVKAENMTYNMLLKLIFLLGAALAVKNGGSLMTSLIDYQAGAAEQQSMAAGMGAVAMVAGSVGGKIRQFGEGRQGRTMARREKNHIRAEKVRGYSFAIKEKSYQKSMRQAGELEKRGFSDEASQLRNSATAKWNRTLNDSAEKGYIKRNPNKADKYSLTRKGQACGFGHSVDVMNFRAGLLSAPHHVREKWRGANKWAAKFDMNYVDRKGIKKGRADYRQLVKKSPPLTEDGEKKPKFKLHAPEFKKLSKAGDKGIRDAERLNRRP